MDKFKTLLAEAFNVFKIKDFVKKGDTFYLTRNNNWGLINFQKSRSSLAGTFSFTINVGVCSNALRKTVDRGDMSMKPDIEDCHWKRRIGFIMHQKQDYWWKIDDNTNLDSITEEIISVIKASALPAIEGHISDESLELEWTIGVSDGLTEFKRHVYLTTLLKLGQKENLSLVIEDLKKISKGKPYEYAAMEHINELETYV